MPQFPGLKMLAEHKGALPGGLHLRLYRTTSARRIQSDPKYRYHLGYPEAFVSPILRLLQQNVFWGKSWASVDGFRIWLLPVMGNVPPRLEINRHFKAMRADYNQALEIAKGSE